MKLMFKIKVCGSGPPNVYSSWLLFLFFATARTSQFSVFVFNTGHVTFVFSFISHTGSLTTLQILLILNVAALRDISPEKFSILLIPTRPNNNSIHCF